LLCKFTEISDATSLVAGIAKIVRFVLGFSGQSFEDVGVPYFVTTEGIVF